MSKRIIVIGGGPGGYVAAIRAAQLGAEVSVIEKNKLGGTCLNIGCIPTKVLLRSAKLYKEMREEGPSIGIFADNLRFDWSTIQKRKNEVTEHLVRGVEGLLKSNGIKRIAGNASLVAHDTVKVDGNPIKADAIIIATGSEPAMPPIPGFDLDSVITSETALSLKTLPESVAIAGGGVIGVEFASIFASFGVAVTIVEMLPQILPNIDNEIAAALRRSLEARGITVHTSSRIDRVTESGGKLCLDISASAGQREIEVEKLLAATGRSPYIKNLGVEKLGIEVQHGRILTNLRMETSVKNIYAVGDCTSPIMLAHVASREGEVAAENIMGVGGEMCYKTTPSAIYTFPEVASVGLSETGALRQGHKIKIGRFPLAANGKSVISGGTDGLVKIISDELYGEILGIHIIGGPATEMIAEGGLALRLESTLEEITSTIHAHPTISEAVKEAALDRLSGAIHMPRRAG